MAKPSVSDTSLQSLAESNSDVNPDVPSRDTAREQRMQRFLHKVQQSNVAVQQGEYNKAMKFYTEALTMDPANYVLYCNRAAVRTKLGEHQGALEDARAATSLNPKWTKAYYREGAALAALGREAEALAAHAQGLAVEPGNTQLLKALVDTASATPLKERLVPVFTQLRRMNLASSPFVLIAVIGQELLAAEQFPAAITLLEAALRIGSVSMKMRGSVFSALGSAHWALQVVDKAIACMQQDLAIARSLGDTEGECRAVGNLASAYFSKGHYREALQNGRSQLALAMRLKDRLAAANALSLLGHVYTAVGDYPNALASHKQCVLLVKQGKDKKQEAREIGSVGAVYLAMGHMNDAIQCHAEHLRLARSIGCRVEEARALSNMGSAYHYCRNYAQAQAHHLQVLTLAQQIQDRTLEARAYAGLGHAARCQGDYHSAKGYHEKQLTNALHSRDKVAEGRACANLGIIYQLLGEYDGALKLHKSHLNLAKQLGDRASQGRAYGNIGNAYSCLQEYEVAIRFHKQELAISKEVDDKHSEMSTHGNLAVAYQQLGLCDKALEHYQQHLTKARQLHDQNSEARALHNIGNYYSANKQFDQAIPYYEHYLSLSQELADSEGEGKACHKLGYVHYCLENYKEAIRYYEQDLALAREIQDRSSMSRAYCNLGLAHKCLGNYEKALECQKYFLATAHMTKNVSAKFVAIGNIGDIYIQLNDLEEATQMYTQQLQLAKLSKNKKLEALALSNVGNVHRRNGQYDKSLGYHTQELTVYQELGDVRGECRAHNCMGTVHVAIGNYTLAYRCYEEQLDRSRDLKDTTLEAQAYGNLAISKMNMGHFDDAIGLFEQQLAMLEGLTGDEVLRNSGKAYGSLGDCYEALGDYEEATKCFEKYLAVSQSTESVVDQNKAYRGLASAHRAQGHLQQALVCYEKRLVLAHELDQVDVKGSAYGELGCLHSLLGNYEQAISCLQSQLRLARDQRDPVAEGDAACGLGGVYQQMGEYERAAENHQIDLDIAMETGNTASQCRAYGNLGLAAESRGDLQLAVDLQGRHLALASQTGDQVARTLAFSSLGRVHHAQGHYQQAVQHLTQGLQTAEQLGRREDEAKIRHRLGLALWGQGQLEQARAQLYRATDLLDSIRREAMVSADYKMSLFDLQTASYQALQRILVSMKRYEEALLVGERGRTRAFVDFLLDRQSLGDTWYNDMDTAPASLDKLLDIVNKQNACVLYYSIAAGFLYSWLILPLKGVVKFHESSLSDLEAVCSDPDTQSLRSGASMSVLDSFVGHVRESLGVDSHMIQSASRRSSGAPCMSETESEADDLWTQHVEELGDRLNSSSDQTGFLRMVNRHHLFNASSASLSSLLSSGGSRVPARNMSGLTPTAQLYNMLLAPMEASLPPSDPQSSQDLVIVLQGDLHLVPFALLKPDQNSHYLCNRYNLLIVPSIRALAAGQTLAQRQQYDPTCAGSLVVAAPRLSPAVTTQWGWGALPSAEQEGRLLGELLGCKPLTGRAATKSVVLKEAERAELIHIASHVSWKLSSIVLSPPVTEGTSTTVHGGQRLDRLELSDSNSELCPPVDGPALSDYLLTAADLLNSRLAAKLVVLSSAHTDDRSGGVSSEGVVGLTRALLAAGAQSVLLALWPVPPEASKMFMKHFYTSLLQGTRTSVAVTKAMAALQTSRSFSHASNWAGWVLVGADIRLSSKVALMGHALAQMLKSPVQSRESMRVVLHLVEKSLQRISSGQKNPAMYITLAGIENKVGEATGWRDLLTAVGFRFEPSNNGLPSSVFFPTADPGDRLTQASASLQAFLGLPVATLEAIGKMLTSTDIGDCMISLIRDMLCKPPAEAGLQMALPVRLWRAAGAHEFLAALGFDLVDVGREEVTIKASKSVTKRTLQYALQALIAVYDTSEAPRQLTLDSASSMESLASSGSATSTSNFSKGSTPPLSPQWKKKSYFNPAEVDKLASAKPKPTVGNLDSRAKAKDSAVSLQLSLQNSLRQKYGAAQESGARVLSVDVAQDADVSPVVSPIRRSLFDKSLPNSGSFFPTSPVMPHPYSTSSDSDCADLSSGGRSQSRNSLSGSSNGRGSGSLTRRSRTRGSQGSIRSIGSDKTLTNDSDDEERSTLTGEPEKPPAVSAARHADEVLELITPEMKSAMSDLTDSGVSPAPLPSPAPDSGSRQQAALQPEVKAPVQELIVRRPPLTLATRPLAAAEPRRPAPPRPILVGSVTGQNASITIETKPIAQVFPVPYNDYVDSSSDSDIRQPIFQSNLSKITEEGSVISNSCNSSTTEGSDKESAHNKPRSKVTKTVTFEDEVMRERGTSQESCEEPEVRPGAAAEGAVSLRAPDPELPPPLPVKPPPPAKPGHLQRSSPLPVLLPTSHAVSVTTCHLSQDSSSSQQNDSGFSNGEQQSPPSNMRFDGAFTGGKQDGPTYAQNLREHAHKLYGSGGSRASISSLSSAGSPRSSGRFTDDPVSTTRQGDEDTSQVVEVITRPQHPGYASEEEDAVRGEGRAWYLDDSASTLSDFSDPPRPPPDGQGTGQTSWTRPPPPAVPLSRPTYRPPPPPYPAGQRGQAQRREANEQQAAVVPLSDYDPRQAAYHQTTKIRGVNGVFFASKC